MIYFLAPVYNEQANIEILFDRLTETMKNRSDEFKIIIVNDGSTDKTEEIVKKHQQSKPIEIISHEINKGVSEGFNTGFSYILNIANDSDIIITLEGDNTSDLAILDEMITNIKTGSDISLASCYAKKGKVEGITLDRKICSLGANILLQLCFPIKNVYTYSSFYRAYNVGSLKKAYQAYENKVIEMTGFVCMAEMLIKLWHIGFKITEVPMTLRCDLRKDASKMKVIKNILGYLLLIKKEFIFKDRIFYRKVYDKFKEL
jgi:dolichol-phosphate mannosyltransferase